MATVFNPALAQEAVSSLQSLTSGRIMSSMQDLYKVLKELGEGNDVVETPARRLMDTQDYYNTNCVPAYNKIIKNFEGFEELSKYVNSLTAAAAPQGEDIGTVKEASYDAARNL